MWSPGWNSKDCATVSVEITWSVVFGDCLGGLFVLGTLFLAQSLKVILVESFAFGKLYTDGGYAVNLSVIFCVVVIVKCIYANIVVWIHVYPSFMFFGDVYEVPVAMTLYIFRIETRGCNSVCLIDVD